MSNLSQFFSGSSGILQQVPIVANATFICPVSGDYLVTAIGGGGGSSGGTNGRGGAAGGFAQKKVTLNAGDTITCVIGASGTAGSASVAGGDGGNTTATATNLSLVANGGKGGAIAGGTSAGGTATGGTINRTGGSTANLTGGAVDVYGNLAILGGVWNDAANGQSTSGLGSIANVTGVGAGGCVAGRLLSPAGATWGEPGVTGSTGRAGMFAGGSCSSNFGNSGGVFGGGAGGSTAANTAIGGRGVVIIEWMA